MAKDSEAADQLNWAQDVLKHVNYMQNRWGKHYDVAKDAVYSPEDIARAAGIVAYELEQRSVASPEEFNKVKRQLTASKAREAKAQKQVEKLREELGDSQQEVQELGLAIDQLNEKVDELSQ